MNRFSWVSCVLALHLATGLAIAQVPGLLHYQGKIAVGGTNFNGNGGFKFSLVDGGLLNSPAEADALLDLANKVLLGFDLNHQGSGYITSPAVTISGGGGSGATATTTILDGKVIGITLTNPGDGYASPPNVVIDPPPAGSTYVTYWSNDGTGSGGMEPTAAVSLATDAGLYAVLLGDTNLPNMTTSIPASVFDADEVNLRVWFDDGSAGFQQLLPDQRIAAVGYALSAASVPPGTITSLMIAPGAIGQEQLANPTQSGSILSSSLQTIFGHADFTAAFSPVFPTTPVVSLTLEAPDPATGTEASLYLMNRTPAGFTGRVGIPAPEVVRPNDAGGEHISLAMVNGRPAVCHRNRSGGSTLRYLLASDADGTDWPIGFGLPVDGGIGESVGGGCDLAIIDGNPGISYHDSGNQRILFIRATDADGTAWATPAVVDPGPNVGSHTSLALVNGHPAIAYAEPAGFRTNLWFARATDSIGTTWGTRVLAASSTNFTGAFASLVVVGGRPAIAYQEVGGGSGEIPNGGSLWYVRANDPNGTSWGAPILVDGNSSVAWDLSMAVINGHPAISHYDTVKGQLLYVRATTATGGSWGSSVVVDGSESVGRDSSLAIINGRPGISYLDGAHDRVKFAWAGEASGTTWPFIIPISAPGTATDYTALADVNGRAGVAFHDENVNRFRYISDIEATYSIHWLAIEP